MEYNKIISVTGLGGLFELIGSKADGAIVRSLEDKTTKFASSRSHHFSHLESIEVYTVRENVNLVEVFRAMKAAGRPIPDYKDISAVKAYFAEVYPDMDFERVYTSDMKKMVRWYNILLDNNIDLDSSEENQVAGPESESEKAETDQQPSEKKAVQEKPAEEKKSKAPQKAAAKKPKASTASPEKKESTPAKAKKKAAPKKKDSPEN